MQPDPFASNSNTNPATQPFSDSTSLPMQSAPIAAPVGATPATSLPPASVEGAPVDATDQPADPAAELSATHMKGANWFFWIVGLSIVNALLISFGSDRVLAIGTNATLIMDALAKDGHIGRTVEVIFDALVIGFYIFCGLTAVRGKTWAFYLGMTVFALDTLFSVYSVDVIGGLLHAWALFAMFQGVSALKQLHALRRAAQAPASPWAA